MQSISVVIPSYNLGRMLEEAVASIEAQPAGMVREIIVVDDGSTDPESLRVLSAMESTGRIRRLANAQAKGSGGARNTGVAAATGDWIAFLDGDDVWTPEHLSAIAEAQAMHPDVAWFGADFSRWSPEESDRVDAPHFTGRPAKYPELAVGGVVRIDRPFPHFLRRALTWTSVTAVRREAVLAAGGFDPTLRRSQDYDLWLRLARANAFVFTPAVGGLYRQHGSNISKSGPPRFWTAQVFERQLALDLTPDEQRLVRARLADFYEQNARWLREHGRFGEARRAALMSLKRRPSARSALNLAGALVGRT